MEIKGEELQVALAKAVIESFTPEMKDATFVAAVRAHLFEPVKDSYGQTRGAALVSRVFSDALSAAILEIARDLIKQPETAVRVRQMVSSALEDALANPKIREQMVEKFSNALGRIY